VAKSAAEKPSPDGLAMRAIHASISRRCSVSGKENTTSLMNSLPSGRSISFMRSSATPFQKSGR
jgi:hypothetical protein